MVGVYTIGQTPRPDLTNTLVARFPDRTFELTGLLDGVGVDEIRPGTGDGYPLETTLRDGMRIVVDAAFLQGLLQAAVGRLDHRVVAHLVLCAGPFPDLTSQAPLVLPSDVGAETLRRAGFGVLDIVVPFRSQAAPAVRKWEEAGFVARAHVMNERQQDVSIPDWLASRGSGADADALVFDYVGFPPGIVDAVSARSAVPVFDLGRLALDALKGILEST